MSPKVRIGAVSYLNTRPLVFGLEQGLGAGRIELSYAVPAQLADSMAAGDLDIALMPIIELARMPGLEVVPGLGIVTHGPSRSVLLVSRRPVDEIRTVALDRDSRTSNALVRVLFDEAWGCGPAFETGPAELVRALEQYDAVVRIGDKALFDPLPDDGIVHDLGTVWTETTGLPFVFAAWVAHPGVVDREIYRMLHESRRRGSKVIDAIADDYTWNGAQYPEIAREYLTHNIRFRLGSTEIRAMERFFQSARRLRVIERAPEIRLAFERWSECHEIAENSPAAPEHSA